MLLRNTPAHSSRSWPAMPELAMVVTGIAVIGRSSAGFERTRRAIDRDEVIQMPRSHMESLLSVALAIAVAIFLRLSRGALTFSAHDSVLDSDRRPPWI